MTEGRTRRHLLIAFSSQLGFKLLGFAVLALMARGLSQAEYGKLMFALTLCGVTVLVTDLGASTDLTALPWTGHRVRRWEPEPFRWAGVHTLYGLYRAADRREDDGLRRTSRIARVANRVAGR